MKVKLIPIILLLCPLTLFCQNYEQRGDSLFAVGQYDKAIKQYNAVITIVGESENIRQKKAKCNKCISLLAKAKAAEKAIENLSDSIAANDNASKLYADLFALHTLSLYKKKAFDYKKKADDIRERIAQIEAKEAMIKNRGQRLIDIKNLISPDGTKQWIFENRKLVHEYYMDRKKDDSGWDANGHNFACDFYLTDKEIYQIEIFLRKTDNANSLKELLKNNNDIWGDNPGTFTSNKCIVATFPETTPNEELVRGIITIIFKMKQTRQHQEQKRLEIIRVQKQKEQKEQEKKEKQEKEKKEKEQQEELKQEERDKNMPLLTALLQHPLGVQEVNWSDSPLKQKKAIKNIYKNTHYDPDYDRKYIFSHLSREIILFDCPLMFASIVFRQNNIISVTYKLSTYSDIKRYNFMEQIQKSLITYGFKRHRMDPLHFNAYNCGVVRGIKYDLISVSTTQSDNFITILFDVVTE